MKNLTITSCPKTSCTGCGSCQNICPKDAIMMEEDEYGHLFPQIDEKKCIVCGLCEKICPSLHLVSHNEEPQIAYAAIACDNKERRTSSSGGAASVFCRETIKKGGVVYGCAQIDSFLNIRHIRVDKEDELTLLKGSKYVQSIIGNTFKEAEFDLKQGRKVCFIGTPCQIAGLKSFLRKDYNNLLTLDLICHGVPSLKFLIEDSKICGIEKPEETKAYFRWKQKNQLKYGLQYISYLTSSPVIQVIKPMPYNHYMTAFMTGLTFRESCHTCFYSCGSRVGDITIGDFWALGAFEPTSFKIHEGVSLIMTNTNKGKFIFETFRERFHIEQRSFQEATNGNANLVHPSRRPIRKNLFKKIFLEKGFEEAVKLTIPKKEYYKMIMIEFIKSKPIFLNLFKKIRLFINSHTR